MKTFTTAVISGLLNQVYREEISFSRMVEAINERVSESEVRKFKKGDVVRIKDGVSSGDKSMKNSGLLIYFVELMDEYIGKELIVEYYNPETGIVRCEGNIYAFCEGWLEPYEELKKGDLAIFWNFNKGTAMIGEYDYPLKDAQYPHKDKMGNAWTNAIKFESKEQYEKLLKGEI